MRALIKCCSCIIAGGGVCTVPFLHLSSSWSDSNFDLIFSADSTSISGRTESWKCSSISVKNVIFPEIPSKHIAFTCKNEGIGENEQGVTKIGLEWTIWVPLTALKHAWDFADNSRKEIVIKTQTSKVEIRTGVYGNRTTFESEGFNNQKIEGTWGRDIKSWKRVEGEQIYRFEDTESGLEGDGLIYLKVKQ